MKPLTLGALALGAFAFLTWATTPAHKGTSAPLAPNAEDSDFCLPSKVTGGPALAYECNAGEIGCKTHPVTDCGGEQ